MRIALLKGLLHAPGSRFSDAILSTSSHKGLHPVGQVPCRFCDPQAVLPRTLLLVVVGLNPSGLQVLTPAAIFENPVIRFSVESGLSSEVLGGQPLHLQFTIVKCM